MAALDDAAYARLVRRISSIIGILGVTGCLVSLVVAGWKGSAGFALGGAVSWLSFRWLKQVVGSVGAEHPAANVPQKAILRYVLLGGVAYVIVRYTVVNLRAALAGLLLTTAAVIVEILIELVYARD